MAHKPTHGNHPAGKGEVMLLTVHRSACMGARAYG